MRLAPGSLVRRGRLLAIRWTHLSDAASFPVKRDQVYLTVALVEHQALLLSTEGSIGWIDCDVIEPVPD